MKDTAKRKPDEILADRYDLLEGAAVAFDAYGHMQLTGIQVAAILRDSIASAKAEVEAAERAGDDDARA